MSPLTFWHYFLIIVLALIFIAGTILAFRSQSKYSIFATLTTLLVMTGFFSWQMINETVYSVEVTQLDDQRLYQSEQLIIRGVVRNTSKFPVAHVIGTVKLVNARGGEGARSIHSQPSAFKEIYKGDDPSFKPNNIFSEHVIADYLNPGSSKSFTIILDYPPYFKNSSYEIEAKVY